MRFSGFAAAVRGLFSGLGAGTTTPARPAAGSKTSRPGSRSASGSHPTGSPGQGGSEATVEVPARMLRRAEVVFDPRVDAQPDPGEVVWTWVPYEENDGRGKDRPVLIVARETSRSVLALQLTSKPHDDDARHFVYVGPGLWDSQGRPSWARVDRVFRVFESGMRREASSVTRQQFSAVSGAIAGRAS